MPTYKCIKSLFFYDTLYRQDELVSFPEGKEIPLTHFKPVTVLESEEDRRKAAQNELAPPVGSPNHRPLVAPIDPTAVKPPRPKKAKASEKEDF